MPRDFIAGTIHTCAIDAAHDVFCWGARLDMMGHSATVKPEPVRTHPKLVEIVAADYTQTCGRSADDSILCWREGQEPQVIERQ